MQAFTLTFDPLAEGGKRLRFTCAPGDVLMTWAMRGHSWSDAFAAALAKHRDSGSPDAPDCVLSQVHGLCQGTVKPAGLKFEGARGAGEGQFMCDTPRTSAPHVLHTI